MHALRLPQQAAQGLQACVCHTVQQTLHGALMTATLQFCPFDSPASAPMQNTTAMVTLLLLPLPLVNGSPSLTKL